MAQAVSHCASSLRWICGERNDSGIGFALSESFRQCSPLVYHRRYPHVILGDYGEWIIRSEFNAQTKSCLHCPDTLRRTVHFNMVAAEAVRLAACVACDYLVYIKVTEKKKSKWKIFVNLHHFLHAFPKLRKATISFVISSSSLCI